MNSLIAIVLSFLFCLFHCGSFSLIHLMLSVMWINRPIKSHLTFWLTNGRARNIWLGLHPEHFAIIKVENCKCKQKWLTSND